MSFQEGSKLPTEGLEFSYIPIDLSDLSLINPLKCEFPIKLKLNNLLKNLSTTKSNSKLLIVSVPGAFTPTCTENHLPPYLENLAKLIDKDINAILIISSNDPFVINAWGKLLIKEYLKNSNSKDIPQIIFASDDGFSSKYDLSNNGRNKRYAAIIDSKTNEVIYLGVETEKGVKNSSIDSVLAKL